MNKIISNLLLTLVLGVICLVSLFYFNRAAAPQDKILPTPGTTPPDYAALAERVSKEQLDADLRALCANETRFTGTRGSEDAAEYISQTFESAGIPVMHQPFNVTVPHTVKAQLLDADGIPIEDLTLIPFIPNWFRTPTTPPDGLTGTVHLGERGLAREFEGLNLHDNFVLLPLNRSWNTVAAMGAAAVLYYDDGTITPNANWDHSKEASQNVPRFLVRGDNPERLDGARVTIQARVDFENRPVRNILGFIEAPGANELLILNAYYDSYSYTPDLAPGAQQAGGAAALLSAARQLATERDDLRRSILLLATPGHAQGLFGAREFVRALGTRERRAQARDDAFAQARQAESELELSHAALGIARSPDYWAIDTADGERAFWEDRSRAIRTTFEEGIQATLDNHLLAATEELTQRQVAWVRTGQAIVTADGREAPAFAAYNAAREQQAAVMAMLATPLGELKSTWRDQINQLRVRDGVVETLQRRIRAVEAEFEQARARADIAERLFPYQRVLFLGLDITAASGQLALVSGDEALASQCMPADAEIVNQIMRAQRELDAVDAARHPTQHDTRRDTRRVVNLLRERDLNDLDYITARVMMYFESSALLRAGHTALTLTNTRDSRRAVGTPFDTLDRMLGLDQDADPAADGAEANDGEDDEQADPTPLDHLHTTARLITAAASQFGRGFGNIVPVSLRSDLHTVRGQVLSKMGGETLTPDYPMPGSIVQFGPFKVWGSPYRPPPGMGRNVVLTADWRGNFALHNIWGPALSTGWQSPIDIDAALIRGSDGAITWTLDINESGPGQNYQVRNVLIGEFATTVAMPVLFRATAVEVVPMSDPATFRSYEGFNYIDKVGLTVPISHKTEQAAGTYVCFVPPETTLYFTFRKGSMANPNLQVVRAFALNAYGPADGSEVVTDAEIYGEGYLAADYPKVTNIELDAAVSMAQVNSRRLEIQTRYNMADDMLLLYNRQAVDLAERARDFAARNLIVPAKRAASESIAYSSNIHPVIRKNASDAVVGILFYLLLAIPFAVFLEKLLIGHPDIRYQIAYQGVIFLAFFMALRAVHPAYELVRSSYMILLGFITFALAIMVGSFVAGRFRHNITELQERLQKKAEVADVSRAGALSTAFVLGLGHMRRRPVRTGLTVATLILITFVLLCFTSVQTDVVDVEFAVGTAPYTGLFVRDRALQNVASGLNPLRELYGADHVVAPRNWAGNFTAQRGQHVERAEFTLTNTVGRRDHEARVNAILGLSVHELEVMPIEPAFDVMRRWFETDNEHSCFLPREVADQLSITETDILTDEVTILIGSDEYTVLGIFDAATFENVLDLDGESLLPVDVLGLLRPGQQQAAAGDEATDVPEDTPRLPGDRVVITPAEGMPSVTITASVAVAFDPTMAYRESRDLITAHLERSAEPTYYGIDGIAFYGGKFRRRSLRGVIELLLPIIIAALTVLNTMRGSVYERQKELYVFNAVGLSPSHVRTLFVAEASVYAVVGAVGGYLLAQGVGTSLRLLGMTAGLTMNYSSLASVTVSIVIMGVVYASSIFPARMAARLAAPAELMARKRSTAQGDVIELDLPFTFNQRDRVAILPYFADWFENFGEGSSGDFFCSDPEAFVREEQDGTLSPCLETTTWLKPYDLGVSQTVTIIVRHFKDTGDNVATVLMTRKTGDSESWERCCHAFIGLLRKRFLTWRAVSDDLRAQLLERGQQLLDKE